MNARHGAIAACRRTADVTGALVLGWVLSAVSGCAYLDMLASQKGYLEQAQTSPQQRIYKHLLDRETFFVFGRIENLKDARHQTLAVVALSDRFRDSEVVDVNHLARVDSYYGLNLPPGDYRLLVVSDIGVDGQYDETEIIGGRAVSLAIDAIRDKVLGNYTIDLSDASPSASAPFRLAVRKPAARVESLFYPRGTIRSLDDPIFGPQMAALGMYAPAAFLEAAPMMFYALEEDIGHKVPVVFVHGIGGSARDLADIVAALDRSRYRPWFFHYPSGMDLDQLAAMFYQLFLSGSVIPVAEMPLVIVAHSMGGLVVREALNLHSGEPHENRVARLITLASPMGGHPAARKASKAPVVIPSWHDLNPKSAFIAGLHRKPLPDQTDYQLLYAYGADGSADSSGASDGVVPVASQLSAAARREAGAQRGFADSHTGVLKNRDAIGEVVRLVSEVRAPYPEAYMRELVRGGYQVELAPHYTPLETYFIRNVGHFMESIASGALAPIHPVQEHFLRAVRGEIAPANELETAWIKFMQDFPDRSALDGAGR